MGYDFDILKLLAKLYGVLADYPVESVVLLAAGLLLGGLWKALKFVMKNVATTTLSYFLTERVLKRLYPPSPPADNNEPKPDCRVEQLSRELGRREASEEALRNQLESERWRADRLEAEFQGTGDPRRRRPGDRRRRRGHRP